MNLKRKFQIGYWNIGIIEKSIDGIMSGKSYEIRWVNHKYKDRFFADPFIYDSDLENYYILAEELIFKKEKGTIVLLTIDRQSMKLKNRKELFTDPFHLSYPNYDGNVIVAENYKSGELSKFYINEVPIRKESFLKIPLIDPTFIEFNGTKWLFATTKEKEIDANLKLSIFYEENGKFIPHKKNPVKCDIKTARPGGKFFIYKNELYRPAQNSEHIYGEEIKIMKVIRLDKEEYLEKEIMTISSHDSKRYNLGLHTFNIGNDFIVVDGFEYSTQILQKIKNKIFNMIKRS